ncbi:MAG: hypothetical protein HC923_10200 [Myxococcales bacterium]|nr:hypothetical protein [Myxococcales bacterium]
MVMPPSAADIDARAQRVRALLLDVDGVLTDGRVLYLPDGSEGRVFHVRDGLGIQLLRASGLKVGILSGKVSNVVKRRAEELGVDVLLLGIEDKVTGFEESLKKLGVTPDDFDPRFAPQCVSTGVPFIITPLKSLDAVRRVKLNNDNMTALRAVFPDLDGMLVFSPQTYRPENHLNVRVLFDGLIGEPEDAATGAANGCLAAYLAQVRYFGTDVVDCRVEQGYEINRRSLLLLKAHTQDGEIQVHVGGQVVLVARGELLL